MKKHLSVLLLLLISVSGYSQDYITATGTVFHDLNKNGIRDSGEQGIGGVAVASRNSLVLTDSLGIYSLYLQHEDEIFVIKPASYSYYLNEYNLPQFYYLHRHKHPPMLKYHGIEQTGPLPENLDFPLLSGSYEEAFSIIVISDPQAYNLNHVEYYEKDIVEELVNASGFSFGITLGDIVGNDLDLFEPINKATARIGIPWFNVIGNHDINDDSPDPYHSDERFNKIYGPSTYAFHHGKVFFIVLNNIIFPNAYTGHYYVGGIRDDQFAFIERALELVPDDHLVVLCMHIPLYNQTQWGETFLNHHRIRLFEVLKDREFTLSLSGHSHTLRHHFFGSDEGWLRETPHHHYTSGAASGDWWSGIYQENGVPESTMYDGTPNGYSIIRFSGNQYTIDYKAAGYPDNYKMRIYGPKAVPQHTHYRGYFYVNFFQGSEKDKVEWKVNDGDWKPMRYTVEPDPYNYARQYVWDHADELPLGVRPSSPMPSYHLWKARVPTNLPAGINTIHVMVTDMYGRIFSEEYSYNVVPVNSN